MYGGTFVNELNVYGNVNMNVEKELGDKIEETLQSGGGQVNNIKGDTAQPVAPPHDLPAPDRQMIFAACAAALTMTDEVGDRLFTKTYYWQSIFRILKDMKVVSQYTEFTDMVQSLYPEDKMPAGCERLYLKHYSNFSGYDNGMYARPFSEWKREDPLTLKVDPRYLIAEEFKTHLDRLRVAAAYLPPKR